MTTETEPQVFVEEGSPGHFWIKHKRLPGVHCTVMDMNPAPMIDVWSGKKDYMNPEQLDDFWEMLERCRSFVDELNAKNGR